MLEVPAVSEYFVVPVSIETSCSGNAFTQEDLLICHSVQQVKIITAESVGHLSIIYIIVINLIVVPVVDKLCLGHVAQVLVILDIVRSLEELCLLAETLACSLEAIGYVSCALRTVLGGDQYNTITSLSTVDSCRSSVLQNLHRLDERRIQILDVVNLQTVNDEQRAEVTRV